MEFTFNLTELTENLAILLTYELMNLFGLLNLTELQNSFNLPSLANMYQQMCSKNNVHVPGDSFIVLQSSFPRSIYSVLKYTYLKRT